MITRGRLRAQSSGSSSRWATRRRLVIAFGASTLVAPFAAFAQQQPAKISRIGFLSPTSASGSALFLEQFQAGLRDLDYVAGKNVIVDYRWADGNYERLSELAVQLAQSKADVIVAATSPAVQALQKATTAIPIVFAGVGDPVGGGFVASLSHPGGNITGLSNIGIDVSDKYLELLRVAVPKLSRVAVLVNPGHPAHPARLKKIENTAKTISISVSPARAGTAKQIDAAVGPMTQARAGALIVLPDPYFRAQVRQIAELAMRNHLPTMFWSREFAAAGGLMSYGQYDAENFRRVATYIDKILKGAKAGDLPVQQATKLELVINLKTAKAIGLTIPPEMVLRADKVIE